MSAETTMLVGLALPALAALGVAVLGRHPDLRDATSLVAGAATFAAMASLLPGVLAGDRPEITLFTTLGDIPVGLALEPLGMLFALVASGLWIVTTAYSIGYMRGHHERHQTRFYAWFAVAIAGALGVALARNLLTLFLFYELLTISTYPLVTHHGTDQARRAGRVYLGVLFGTSVGLLLLAVIWTYSLAGTLEFRPGGILGEGPGPLATALLLGLFAFGTGKAALMPFHRWLPAAMVAPAPVSALLHAVAVVKAGVFTVVKVVVYVFGIDLLRDTGASAWLAWVAGFTVIAASVVALTKDNLKARLAYSTVSQLGYIVLGAALADGWAVIGGGMHIATHAFGKITLFFCAGAIYVAAHKTEVSDMAGIGRRMPVTLLAFLVGSLSVIGLPPFAGAWSKWFLALGAADAGELAFVAVYMVSSLLSIGYLMPVVVRGFFAASPADQPAGVREAPLFCVVPLCFTALGCLVLFFAGDGLYRLLLPLGGGS